MNIDLWLDSTISTRLCLMLLHSLWQIMLLAAIAWLVDRLWKRSVERSYAIHIVALFASLATLPVTYALVDVAPGKVVSPGKVVATGQPIPSPKLADAHLESDTLPPTAVDVPQSAIRSSDHSAAAIPEVAAPTAITTIAGTGGTTSSAIWRVVAWWVVAVYTLGVLLMLARLLNGLWCAHRQATNALRLHDGPVIEMLASLARQWSMRVAPVLAVAEGVVVPQVVGILRPMILLPPSILTGLSADELQMILAHELAHIRRHDMWVNLLQRLAETVLFFHPALWYLTHRTSELREFCCDEYTCRALSPTASAASRTGYAAALIRVAELSRAAIAVPDELVTLAASGHSPSQLHRRIARLFDEPVRESLRLSRGSVAFIIISTTLLLLGPAVWQARTEEPAVMADTGHRFELLVVDSQGNPVPDAPVELRINPSPSAKQILVGSFTKTSTYGPFVRTDSAGRLAFERAAQPRSFQISLVVPGYGPYSAGWNSQQHPQEIPNRFVAELEDGWSVGGIVVDEQGKPVEGARVHPSISFKKRPGDPRKLGIGRKVATDAEGKWRYDSVPVSKASVFVEINHPDFMPNRQSLPREGFGLSPDQKPAAKIVLKQGLTVTGRVTDENGQPLENVLIRTKFLNDIREAHTGRNGNYTLIGCEPGMAKIVASATGRAIDMQEVRVDPDLPPVNFSLQPGGKVRIRVVDEQGNGIPKARILFQHWRGFFDYFEFRHVNQYADKNGVWEWNEAPLDEFRADICRPGGMQLSEQRLIARDEEYVFTPPKALVVSGRVIDATTGKPVPKFRVIPGHRNADPEIRMTWNTSDRYEATDGKYQIRLTQDYQAHLVRIEAESYKVAISRDIQSDEGEIQVDFELQPAKDIAAVILTPEGAPARGARIALGVAGTQISIKNGEILDSSTFATRLDAGDDGSFRIPARNEPYQLIIMHPQGFASLKSAEQKIPATIRLTPWARVEGVFRVGLHPAPNVGLSLYTNTLQSYEKDVPRIFTQHNVTTGTDGRYVFERVVPGKGWIGRSITLMVNDGATEVTSSIRVQAQFPAGETTTLNLGGNGRAVIGKLVPAPDTNQPVLWNFALVNAQVNLPQPKSPAPPAEIQNDAERFSQWWKTWIATPEGKTWQSEYEAFQKRLDESPYLTATVDRQGAFRIDDVTPGDYMLNVRFSQHSAGSLSEIPFTVSAGDDLPSAPPLDLGELKLQSPAER